MVYWNRFISYIYRYHECHKCENAGFAKVAKAGRSGRLTIGLKNGINGRETSYEVYVYRETLPSHMSDAGMIDEDKSGQDTVMIPLPVLIGRMCLRGGRGEQTFAFEWDNVGDSGRPITAFAGIAVRPLRNNADQGMAYYENDMFCSSWTDSVVDYSHMWDGGDDAEAVLQEEELGEAAREVSITDTAAIEDKTEEALRCIEEHPGSDTGAAVEEMFGTYEKLPLLPGSALDDGLDSVIESVKITPNDIGLLDMCNWKLGVNSFLTHGYYSYKYLMLGKVMFTPEKDQISYILGVPGVYSSREKYLAGIFGFDRFVPEKETHIKTGSFGYWIVDIR